MVSATARHEAAHAVVALALGVGVECVTTRPSKARMLDGCAFVARGTCAFDTRETDRFRRALRAGRASLDESIARMVVCFAGGAVARGGTASDRETAESIAATWARGDEESERAMLRLARRQAALLAKRHRRSIARVARALDERGALSGRALRRLAR